jgi:excisionase family DNA binding protein
MAGNLDITLPLAAGAPSMAGGPVPPLPCLSPPMLPADRRDEPSSRHTPERSASETEGGGDLMQTYTVEQVAEILQVGRDKIYFLLRTGQLRSIKIGKLRRITDEHFITSLEEQQKDLTKL